MSNSLPTLGQINQGGNAYRTEPVLTPGAEIDATKSIIVGHNKVDDMPESVILLGAISEIAQGRNRLNWGVWLDATFPHVILIVGKRGSGKSYDLGIIAEGLCATSNSDIARGTEKFAMILFDTQNQFWTLSEPNVNLDRRQTDLINQWKINKNELKCPTIYRPKGTLQSSDNEVEFALRPGDLEPADWLALCGLERFTPMGQCLFKARTAMEDAFSLDDMVEWLRSDEAADEHGELTRDAVRWRVDAQIGTGLFDSNAEDICARLGTVGAKSVVQLADLDEEVKAVIVAVIMRKLMRWAAPEQRRRRQANLRGEAVEQTQQDVAPRIWTLIDEAHLICPSDTDSAARPVVVDYVKRGRDAGLSLVLATQRPSAIDIAAISQSDIVVVHKLTIDTDIDSATARMPARPPTNVQLGRGPNLSKIHDLARILEGGQSFFADTDSDRAFLMQSRPRITPHGGGEPDL